MRFSKFSVVSFWIDSIAQNENPETPEIFLNLWKLWISFVKISETLITYARTMILTVWTSTRPRWTNFHKLLTPLTFIISSQKISVLIKLFEHFLSKLSVLTHENSIPLIYLPLEWSFLNIPPFPFFRIGSITQNENPEMPGIINSLKMLIFFYKLSKTLLTYAKTIMLRLWIPIRPKYNLSTNLQRNFYCFPLTKSLTRFKLSSAIKTARSILVDEKSTPVICLPMRLRFSKSSVLSVFSNWHRSE